MNQDEDYDSDELKHNCHSDPFLDQGLFCLLDTTHMSKAPQSAHICHNRMDWGNRYMASSA
jgi:hypothetical protein